MAEFLISLHEVERLGRALRVTQKISEDFLIDVANDKSGQYARFCKLSAREGDGLYLADVLKRLPRQPASRLEDRLPQRSQTA